MVMQRINGEIALMKICVRFIRNVAYAFIAQGISFLLSIVMSLVVPKLLGTQDFAYWQLFLFYSNYVGFLTLGLNDGIYLKVGGEKYEQLNYNELGSQIKVSMFIQLIIVLGILCFVYQRVERMRYYVLIFTGIFAFLNNLNAYLVYIFQATNNTKKHSISVIIEKMFFLICVVIVLRFQIRKFQFFIILYCISKLVTLLYVCYEGRKLLLSKPDGSVISIVKKMLSNMSVGVFLMLANISSMLILGNGRYMIDRIWGISVFGKFSFALSLCNLALAFIAQISMVLFPELRQSSYDRLKEIYIVGRHFLEIFLPIVLWAYFPLKVILNLWLPNYKDSIYILGFLLPLCTYDGKMNLLCNTYFKVLGKEKILLFVNALAMAVSFLISILGAYCFQNRNVIVFGMVFAIAMRSIISESILARYMKVGIKKDILMETILVILYVLSITFFSEIIAFLFIGLLYGIFLIINKKNIDILYNKLKVQRRNNE